MSEPSGENPPPRPYRLDPDRVVADAPRRPAHVEPVIDTRRYRWTIGIFGLALVIAFSVYMFTTRGIQNTGVPAGQKLHRFVAPLATAALSGDANVNPHCNPAHPNPQALNVCGRTPLALALFASGSSSCVRAVDALQQASRRFRTSGITFAAVAVDSSRSRTASLVRAHGWTIPVAYDPDGAVGALYGVDICPMFELAYRGGTVARQLIGEHWSSASALTAQVRATLVPR